MNRLLSETRYKILTRDDLAVAIRARQQMGERGVFTNGCFDLLHLGHIRYLQEARALGDFLLRELQALQQKFPNVVKVVRGVGLMIGIEFQPQSKAVDVVKELHGRNVLTVPAGNSVIRLLPALNLRKSEAEEGLRAIEKLIVDLANKT